MSRDEGFPFLDVNCEDNVYGDKKEEKALRSSLAGSVWEVRGLGGGAYV